MKDDTRWTIDDDSTTIFEKWDENGSVLIPVSTHDVSSLFS